MRRAILESAAQVFARRGYSGATVTEIARLAATPTATVYRQFGSKEALFTAAVVDPFLEFLADYTSEYKTLIASDADPAEDYRAIFEPSVEILYDHLDGRGDAALALISALRDPEASRPVRDAASRMDRMFEDFNQMSVDHWERSGHAYRLERTRLWTRLITAMVLGVTALSPLLLPHGSRRPDREELLETIGDMLREGLA